jgi:hypothetical protein
MTDRERKLCTAAMAYLDINSAIISVQMNRDVVIGYPTHITVDDETFTWEQAANVVKAKPTPKWIELPHVFEKSNDCG